MPKVSIIVPVYNSEQYLERMIDSLLNQTLDDIEIILVDDGSNDRSGAICDGYEEKNHRIKVIHQYNQGAGAARNAGLVISTGTYVGFVDSDDWVELNMYEKMYSMAAAHHADVVRCNTISHEKNGDRVTWCPDDINKLLSSEDIKSKIIPLTIAPEREGDYLNRLLKGCVCCIFLRTFVLRNHLIFKNVRHGQDGIFTFEALWAASSLVLMKEPLYHYQRQSSGSLSLSMNKFRNYEQRLKNRSLLNDIVCNSPYYPIYISRWKQADRRFVFLDLRIATIYNPTDTKAEKISLIKEVLNSKECKDAFSNYKGDGMPIQMRILYYLIVHNHPHLLYYAISLKYR